ncbi:MAG: glycosyltransferase family 2 protein [Candidatus Aquilonibacter sp.]
MSLPKFSFIVPVRNESARIDACLSSICNQRYPAELVEIIVPDQGSEDDTRERARSYGATVIENPPQRGIFALPGALRAASGELYAIMAADNRVDPTFCSRMASAFQRSDVKIAFPFVSTDRPDYALAVRYINRFTDPFNHFIYGDASNPRDLNRAYQPFARENGYSIYHFPQGRPPLLATAQGMVLRAPIDVDGYADDVAIIFDILQQGHAAACVEDALCDHYTATSLSDVLRKFRRIIAKNFKPASSLRWRDRYLPPERIARRRWWPLYAISFVGPLAVGIYRAIRDREPLWLYHPIISFAFAFVTAQEAAKNLPRAVTLLNGGASGIDEGDVSRE